MRLCPYHEDSLGWDECSEGFVGCEFEDAREEEIAKMEDNKIICPVCGHVISDFDESVSDPCEHVMLSYTDILSGEFVHVGDEQLKESILGKYERTECDKSLYELMSELADTDDGYVMVEQETSGMSCGPCWSTEYHLIKLN